MNWKLATFSFGLYCASSLLSIDTQAQLDYKTEQKNRSLELAPKGLYLNWYNNNYFKNNEYYLNTASGYTLFGTQHIPSLSLKASKLISIQAGAYLRKDFGTEGFKTAAPYFLASLNHKGYSLNFGHIASQVNHGLYDPIYAQERLITNHLEEGISLKVNQRKIYSETWISWDKQQYHYANYNEQFTVGHHSKIKLWSNNSWRFDANVQALAVHSGGQLDTTQNPTNTAINASLGLKINKWFKGKRGLNELGANFNYLIYKDLDENIGRAFNEGHAIYANVNARAFRYWLFSLSYWDAHQFIAPKGDVLFQSVSDKPTDPNFVSPKRQMLQLGVAYERQLNSFSSLSVRLAPFYDFTNERLDYSYSLMLTMQPNILLLKAAALKIR